MTDCESLPPILPESPSVLVLGSVPGEESLRRRQYYAHPRNAFWPIMSSILGLAHGLPYEARVKQLKAAGIAVWDVIGKCRRDGSLDSAIVASSEVPNPVAEMLDSRPSIRLLLHNGRKSEEAFSRHISPLLGPDVRARIVRRRLPSTSPAHASLTMEKKRDAWTLAIRGALGAP